MVDKNIINEIGRHTWTKNWMMRTGIIFCSWYGDMYTNTFEKSIGKRFNNTILAYTNGLSVNYIPDDEMKGLAEFIKQKIGDVKTAKEWCEDIRKKADYFMGLMGKLEKKDELTLDDYNKLSEALHSHVPVNFSIKKVADYLPKEMLEKLLHDFQEARNYNEPVYGKVEEVIKKFNRMIGKRENIPEELVSCMNDDEIIRYLRDGVLPGRKVLTERSKGCILWYHDGKGTIFTGKDAEELEEVITKPSEGEIIKGTPAYKGKAQGRVRIVFDPFKAKEFNKGDILVTGMTRPEFLSLMEKSAAFVTDAGGMLSHAAIVARELKKPCIVGTENATKILKDGDFVEVDADNGTIRKIR